MEGCDGQDEARAGNKRRLPSRRLSHLAGPVLASPDFCSGSPAGRSGSTRLGSLWATNQQRVTANGRRVERAAQSSATSAWAACNSAD